MTLAPHGGHFIPGRLIPGRCFIDLRSLRVTAAMMVAVMTLAPCVLPRAQSVPAGTTQIIPDGRTRHCRWQPAAASTNITTSTISGGNAFVNSFFAVQDRHRNHDQPAGAEQCQQPDQRGARRHHGDRWNPELLQERSDRRKRLHSLIPMASWSASRAPSACRLASTSRRPPKQFIDGVIGPQGQINGAATNQLINGDFPPSPDGHYRNPAGRINAQDGVRLIGQSVVVGAGGNRATSRGRNHAAKFAATGQQQACAPPPASVRNGSIQIVAGGGAPGSTRRLAAVRPQGRNGGTISVAAGKDISVGSRAAAVDRRQGRQWRRHHLQAQPAT